MECNGVAPANAKHHHTRQVNIVPQAIMELDYVDLAKHCPGRL